MESQKMFPFLKMAERMENVGIHTHPIALRKAKIVCNFGLSECNRVKTDI